MTLPDASRAPQLPRTMTVLLIVLGVVLGAISFAITMTMPDMAWHPARDAELRATYEAYQETGTLLIKETGSGSYGVQAPAPGPLTFATWDDDPGSYIIASLMGDVTGSASPYPGLKLAQALLVAIPLLWLPLAVARVVGRSRAGFALILLPLVVWLFNQGTVLVGTEYGLSDRVSTLPVYSLYGTAASLAFLSLSLVVLLSTYRLRWAGIVGATVGIAVLAAFGNLSRSLSGIGVAVAVGVLWWIFARGKWRWIAAVGGAALAVLLAVGLQNAMMTAINSARATTTGQAMTEVPDAHTAWHSLYLGLSYPQPLNGQPSRFGVTWADEYGWAKAREVDPDVLVASEEYDEIMKDLYLHEVTADPVGALILYAQKAIYLLKHFGGMVLFIGVGFAIGIAHSGRLRRSLLYVLAISAPLLFLGLIPPIMVMPMLYYYSELAAVLGLLCAISLGVMVWALLSWPSRIRVAQRVRNAPADADVVADTVIFVDGDPRSLKAGIPADHVHSTEAGRREMVLSHPARRILFVRDPSRLVPEAARRALESSATIAVVAGLPGRSLVGLLRKTILGSDDLSGAVAVAVDGAWGLRFAEVSQTVDALWYDEMAYAARLQGREVERVVETGANESEIGVVRAVGGFTRISLRKDEYIATFPPPTSRSVAVG